MIETIAIPQVTAVGTAGTTATGTQTASRTVSGRLLSIGITQANTPHANTDITISVANGVATRTLLALTNYNTTTLTWFNVRGAICGQTGTALVYAGTDAVADLLPVDGYVTVLVAQGGSGATCDVVIVVER